MAENKDASSSTSLGTGATNADAFSTGYTGAAVGIALGNTASVVTGNAAGVSEGFATTSAANGLAGAATAVLTVGLIFNGRGRIIGADLTSCTGLSADSATNTSGLGRGKSLCMLIGFVTRITGVFSVCLAAGVSGSIATIAGVSTIS